MREGQAPFLIRRKGAEGNLPVPLNEKLEILAILSEDPDESIRNTAFTTFESWDRAELEQVVSNPEAPPFLLEIAVRHLSSERKELAAALRRNPALPNHLREWLEGGSSEGLPGQDAQPTPLPDSHGEPSAQRDSDRETLLQKINRMSVPQKINAALMGSQEERSILVHDANKTVSRAVIQSPKLTDQEIESIAAMKNVNDEILRLMSLNRKFMRSYAVVRNLVNNPRAPVSVGLPLVNRLNDRDLRELSRNKNVAGVLRSTALKLVKQKEQANKA